MAEEISESSISKKRAVWKILSGVMVFVLGGAATVVLQRYVPAFAPPIDAVIGYQPLAANKIAWPRLNTCDEVTVVAMPSGILGSPASITHPDGQDPRDSVITAGGGSYLAGSLTIALATKDTSTAQIVDIRTRLFRTFDNDVQWILNAGGGGCGGLDIRLFEARLDEGGRVLDRGVENGQEKVVSPPKKQPLGTGFTVSAADQTQVLIKAISCAHSYAWGVEIHYIVAGQPYVYAVGTAEEPLISLGRRSTTTRLYGDDDPFDDLPPTQKPFNSRKLPGEETCAPA